MGLTKTESFTKEQNRLAVLAKAIGHPARVAILEYLLNHQVCICNDLVDELPLSQSTISQHLKELKQVGIIKGEIDGPKMCYCINEQVWNEAKKILSDLFNIRETNNSCC